MPKATRTSRSHVTREDPTKTTSTKTRTGRDSHLYTDDNPKTTIHGTGFKDKAAAERTLKLIEQRSLIYQFQTVNTMYNRAKHHPAMKNSAPGSANTSDMRAAMDVFREWLDVTYPAAQASLRGGAAGGFKPLLSKNTVDGYREQINASGSVSDMAKQFAEVYCHLPKGKKLGNVLVDDSKPMEPDWERRRYMELDGLVPAGEGKEDGQDAWKWSELWAEDRVLSEKHLELVAWAWSPVPAILFFSDQSTLQKHQVPPNSKASRIPRSLCLLLRRWPYKLLRVWPPGGLLSYIESLIRIIS